MTERVIPAPAIASGPEENPSPISPERPLTRRAFLKYGAIAAGTPGFIATCGSPSRAAAQRSRRRRDSPVDLVNPLQGTDSSFGFSRGNTLPIISRPFGMNHWSLQTHEGDGWYFDPNALKIQGVRLTHQPSPWMGDYGKITILAQSGETAALRPDARAAAYRAQDLAIHPHYLSLPLTPDGTHIELTPTERGAIFRFTFPAGKPGRVLIDAHTEAKVDAAGRTITGCSRHKSGGAPANFGHYFHAAFDQPVTSVYRTRDHQRLLDSDTADSGEIGAVAEFARGGVVVMRIATSFISPEQTRLNLTTEVGSRSFEAVAAAGEEAWNAALGAIKIDGGTDAQRRTFYSCLYRCSLFPRPIHEFDAAGKKLHYSPWTGNVHDGPLYTDTGLWDGYRTLYPLLALIQPARLGEIVQGFLNAYTEGGWLPQWPSPGTRGGMGGTHSDAVIADAILKNIPGFDRELAYAAILKNATVPPGYLVFEGRPHLAEYHEKGYVAGSVSNSLDFAYDDGCVALAAERLGKKDDYALLSRRAQNYRKLYDPKVGFMRGREADGSWSPNFDEFAWGGPYTEGGAWQWSGAAAHDPAGLIEINGGQAAFLRKLDRMLLQPPTFHPGGYGQPIHEMREMAAVPFGQYDQGNQPVHDALYLFTAAGSPWKTQYWARRVMDKLYSPDGYPGDEDNGEMAAWYVLNAIGLFPLCTGHDSYVIGSPLFRGATIAMPGGKPLTILAPANAPERVYVTRVTRNGEAHTPLTFKHQDLESGGEIVFEMAAAPVARPYAATDLPFAFSAYPPIDGSFSATAVHIDSGGDGQGEFVGDCFFEGGTIATDADASAPGAKTGGGFTWRTTPCTYRVPLPMLPEDGTYQARLQFVATSAGQPLPQIRINGKAMPAPEGDAPTVEPRKTVTREFKSLRPEIDGTIVIELSAPASSKGPTAGIIALELISEA